MIDTPAQLQKRSERKFPCGLTVTTLWGAGICLAAAAGLLVSCASAKHEAAGATVPRLVWPPPPDAPYVVYLRSITQPADVQIKSPALKRLVNWVTGMGVGEGKLVNPFGLALDESGSLCITDTGANVVCLYDEAGKKWHRWDRAGKIRFVAPVAVAKKGDVLFVADSGLARVLAFNTTGQLLFQINHDLGRPVGLAILNDRLYVADVGRHCIAVFDLNGNFIFRFGRHGADPGDFNYPTHASADGQGHLLVTDSMNSRVQIFDADGHFLSAIGSAGDTSGHFGRPKGVAVDKLGHIYVMDALYNNVQIFDPSGKLLLILGGSGIAPGEFALPNGIAISADNRIYVADCLNHRIQVFQYIGPS
jgi:DNA-binding beta-propeller fold protein YncE